MRAGPLELVIRRADVAGLRLRKALPKGTDRLLLELVEPGGRLVAGEWLRQPATAAEIARQLQAMHGPGAAALLGEQVVIARGGSDRRLPALRSAAARPGAALVAHRAERRGVVRTVDGSYLKFVRPSRLDQLVASLTPVDVPGTVLPTVTAVDVDSGCVRLSALPGRTLHDLLADADLSDEVVAAVLRQVGTAMADLHRSPTTGVRTRHHAPTELDVTRRWLRAATDYDLLTAQSWTTGLGHARDLLSAAPTVCGRLHRDLHDKQLLIAPGEPVGLLDLDLTTTGEPALDLANLLAHLELRQLQGRIDQRRQHCASAALLTGYSAAAATIRRLPGYLATARLRLAAVYAFRAADPGLVRQLLDPTHDKELIG